MNWKRLSLPVLLALAAWGAGYGYLKRQEAKGARVAESAPPPRPAPSPARPWRWQTEPEWVVHEITRHVASWAVAAGRLAPDEAVIRVRRAGESHEPGAFEVDVTTRVNGTRTATLRPTVHVWDPEAYLPLVRALFGAAGKRGPNGAALDEVAALLLASDAQSLRTADGALLREMLRRPLDPRLHGQAALLWGAHALRETDGTSGDDRPFLNGLVAHLSLSRSFGTDQGAGEDAAIAAILLDALLLRQTQAMEALDGLEARERGTDAERWSGAIRMRVTADPRRISAGGERSRIEMLEGLRAILRSESCRRAVDQARAWRLPLAADWVRASVSACGEPEWGRLSQDYLAMQVDEAARLIDLQRTPFEAVLNALQGASAANTHRPERPQSVVPAYVRADAGLRHVLSGFELIVRDMSRLSRPEDVKMLWLATEEIRGAFPQRALFESTLEAASERGGGWRAPSVAVCERVARLVIDRPDLVTDGWWTVVSRCQTQPPLRVVKAEDYLRQTVRPGTGRIGTGAWQPGIELSAGLAEAARRAPWDGALAGHLLLVRHEGEAPPSAVLAAYRSLVDYDVSAMAQVATGLRDTDDARVRRLAERVCEVDVEGCAAWADYLSMLGLDEPAERMWQRALAGAQDRIGLSNRLGRYVNLLLDRGRIEEALRLAQSASDVYSEAGLFTLAFALERLGRFDDAAREYAKITRRYEDKEWENTFFVRYRQRHGGNRFERETALAMAELFPKGLRPRTLEEFRRTGHQGGLLRQAGQIDERLWRVGVRPGDFITAVDGYVVETDAQMSAVLTFTDEPKVTLVVLRQKGARGWIELSGAYRRWKYGRVTAPATLGSPASRVAR